MTTISKEHIMQWYENKLINPLTKRKIKENGPIYKKYNKLYLLLIPKKDRYYEFRKKKIDPILLVELPLFDMSKKDLFIYYNKWNPYNGNIIEIDSNGPLYFDPNTLIHHFYTRRLEHLWINDENGEFSNHYGDGVGNGPDFIIKGRGSHPDWYLFRLPIIDCYLNDDHCMQSVTMGPILTEKDIKQIYKLSKSVIFKKLYGYKRPNLIKMKILYDEAIDKNIHYDLLEVDGINLEDINQIKFQQSTLAVNKLIKFK